MVSRLCSPQTLNTVFRTEKIMTTITFGDALGLVEVSDVLSAEIISIFTTPVDGEPEALTALRKTNAAEIAIKTKAAFALELKPVLFEHLRPRALAISGAILEELRAMEIAPAASEAPAVTQVQQQPLEVKVNFPTSIDDMRLSELLLYISTNPGEAREAIEVLKAKSVVKKASLKTLKFAIRASQGGVDALLTNEYLAHLAKDGTNPLPKYKGSRPVTLETALGLESRLLVHPFTGGPISGFEETLGEYDFADLPEELHLALIWAKKTSHRAWISNPDLFTVIPEIFQNPLPKRWATILEDYQDAKANADSSTEGLSRYYNGKPPAVPSAYAKETVWRMPFGNPEEVSLTKISLPTMRTEAEWRTIVLENVQFPPIAISSGGSRSLPDNAYPGGSVNSGGTVTFANTILVGNLHLNSGASAYGNVRIAKGCEIKTGSGASDNTRPVYLSWKQIAELMQLA